MTQIDDAVAAAEARAEAASVQRMATGVAHMLADMSDPHKAMNSFIGALSDALPSVLAERRPLSVTVPTADSQHPALRYERLHGRAAA